jgi:hypothetical protein
VHGGALPGHELEQGIDAHGFLGQHGHDGVTPSMSCCNRFYFGQLGDGALA